MSKTKLSIKTVQLTSLTDTQWIIIEKKIDTGSQNFYKFESS